MRLRHLIGSCALALATTADAKPLPAGLTLKVGAKGELTATRAGVTVPVGVTSVAKLVKAELDADGATLLLTTTDCWTSDDQPPVEQRVPLAPIEANFENSAGMKAHLAHKYDDAIAHFATAVKKDPTTAVYATNLLSAQSMGGKLDDADHALADAAKHNVAWLAWRLAVDSDLKALRGRPSTKLVAKPGTAKGSLANAIAYSPLGLAATEVYVDMYDGIPDGSATSVLSIIDVASGRELLTLPTQVTCAVDMEAAMSGNPNPPASDKACPKREAAATARKRKVTNAVLADLGFVVVPNGFLNLLGGDDARKELVTPDGHHLVRAGDDFTLDGKPVELAAGRLYGVGAVPHGFVVVSKGDKQVGCNEADGAYRAVTSIVPAP
jgi:hypothetical protein